MGNYVQFRDEHVAPTELVFLHILLLQTGRSYGARGWGIELTIWLQTGCSYGAQSKDPKSPSLSTVSIIYAFNSLQPSSVNRQQLHHL